MLIKRPFWEQLIEDAWKQRNIVWLMGVRRVGKTSLCMSLPDITYFDCERPRVRQLMDDPEGFLASQSNKRIVLDEIHRLDNPSEILKLAADHYPTVKIIATGSSTLGASAKFRDTLTGRKKEIWLTPLLLSEMSAFGDANLSHRFLFGGCPAYFTKTELPEDDFREWIDAYWAKDIQELFQVGKRYSFQKFTELLLAHSGGQFEATTFTGPCEVSRPTIANYLAVLEETLVIHVIRPYSTYKPNEIVMAPKVYGFDTGFVCYAKGWRELRPEDMGLLWEQCVLNELHAHLQNQVVHYWRNKQGHEIDFVVQHRTQDAIDIIECKFGSTQINNSPSALNALSKNIASFRALYPKGTNYIVSYDIDTPFVRTHHQLELSFVNTKTLIAQLSNAL